MKLETLLPETLRDWAEDARVPHDLADRALRGRPRRPMITVSFAAGATAAVVVAGVLAPRLIPSEAPGGGVAVAVDPSPVAPSPGEDSAAPTPEDVRAPDSVLTDTENPLPKKLIAAGRVAVSAYYVWAREKIGDRSDRRHETWFLYNAGTGTYEQTDWAKLDVAPGMKLAAVLERDLPARRVGVLDMTTLEVVKWVDFDHPVADVSWSPDGTKLLATAYDKDPTIRTHVSADGNSWRSSDPGRTGFQVVDVASGRASFHPVPAQSGSRRSAISAFRWSDDGTLISEPDEVKGYDNRLYYDLDGRRQDDAPKDLVKTYQRAGVSPNGALYADEGTPPGPETTVKDVATGKVVGRQKMLQLLAWADDGHLIALGCAGACENEFHNGLVLVSIDGKTKVQLSGNRENTQRPRSWEPLFTRR
ncbi:hypothetical protein OG589_32195 [Sphaerisporangium sp. NBC_01403]|uniref:hypothetical protein n=1 Tax=Sphaerisporangium sp. NBC_01403 TaxID=2903599 RepID=UPI003243A73C